MRHLEDNLQASCFQYFSYQFPELRGILFACPNGGYRNIKEAARLKKAGVVPGVADAILLKSNGKFNSLCIEFKAGDKGKQSDLQKSWQELAEKHGNKYVICRSFDQFRDEIQSYLSLKS